MNAKHTLRDWLSFLVVTSIVSYALQSSAAQVLYEQGRTTVQIEGDPTAEGTSNQGSYTHPIPIESDQLIQLLRGIRLQTEPGFLGNVLPLGASSKPVFAEEDLTVLGPILTKGLRQAQPSERISFSIGNPRSGRTLATTAGFVSIRGSYLRFVLVDHPFMALPPQENPSPLPVTLEFVKEEFLRPGTETARRGDIRVNPVLEIDYQRYLSSPATQSAKPAPSAAANDNQASQVDPTTVLQQQVQELTRSNQELQAQLKELRQQLEQRQPKLQESATTNADEVARLRQELAEVKQLLAEKVLELNRLKNNPKAKATVPSER